jgi:hypothetical protein
VVARYGFHRPLIWSDELAFILLAFVILGSVLEGIPAIVLFGPLLFPIARAVGVHEVHYAMIIILAMGIGLFAPPFGVGYYAACAIGRVDPNEGIRPIWGYLRGNADERNAKPVQRRIGQEPGQLRAADAAELP